MANASTNLQSLRHRLGRCAVSSANWQGPLHRSRRCLPLLVLYDRRDAMTFKHRRTL
ncbi:hypothetical protein BKA93DRAFT_793688 [Sparassis latifolia]